MDDGILLRYIAATMERDQLKVEMAQSLPMWQQVKKEVEYRVFLETVYAPTRDMYLSEVDFYLRLRDKQEKAVREEFAKRDWPVRGYDKR